ncbi:hypothetical protein [Geothrix sp. PMB-07]|uniref:hypothetical protein n=1 Tax=Geothrix sp. PMB-07 TaxID=3068640 RepID=UPI0027427EE6|nr:hypothetical protein [Geothrix sp. PMB-07]WLT30757.1 hypothetical protein Q9293_13635 [Geothrix sp. PMB-07]
MWLEILRAQVAARGLGAVAKGIDYSKTTISLVLNGKYNSDTSHLETAVLKAYGTVLCPFEERSLSASDCQNWQSSEAPTSSAWSLRHWAACQSCIHNTNPKGANRV